ncbi:MAG: PH domain-containing protein [Candidatus Heritagella sp.]
MGRKNPPIEYIWKDRRRVLGLPLSFTRYRMSEDRLFLVKGFFNMHMDEVLLYRVRDLSLSRTLGQRLFGMGTITVYSSDKTLPELRLKNIRHSLDVKEMLHAQVEEMKMARRMRLSEVMGDHDFSMRDDNDLDDDSDLDDEMDS